MSVFVAASSSQVVYPSGQVTVSRTEFPGLPVVSSGTSGGGGEDVCE